MIFIIQAIDQGIITACNSLYKKYFLKEEIIFIQDNDKKYRKFIQTRDALRSYDLKFSFIDLFEVWNILKIKTCKMDKKICLKISSLY